MRRDRMKERCLMITARERLIELSDVHNMRTS